jgi:hypothetical protein
MEFFTVKDPTDMPFTGVKIQPPPDFSSTVSTNKMLYDIPGMVLLQVLTAVWMNALR